MARKVKTIHVGVTNGELDPRLFGRPDTEQYYRGAAKLRNCYLSSSGAVSRRPGSRHLGVYEYPVAYPDDEVRSIPYIYPNEFPAVFYDLVFRPGSFDVVKKGSDSILATVAITFYDDAALEELTYTQEGTELVLFHPDFAPVVIERGADDVTWSVGLAEFRSIPQSNFPDTVGSSTDHVEEITFVTFQNGDRYTIYVDGVETAPITFSATPATTAANLVAAIEALPFVDADNVSVVNTLSAGSIERFTITMQNNNSGREWTFGEGEVLFDEVATANNLIRFATVTKGSPPLEDEWSDDRGWPIAGCFFGGRFYLFGTRSRPTKVWASRAGDYTDFIEPEDALADSAFHRDVPFGDGAAFRSAVGSRFLVIGTSESCLYVPVSGEPITPENFTLRKIANVGVAWGLPMYDLDGSVYFVQADFRALRRLKISADAVDSYADPEDLSLLAPHLIGHPLLDPGEYVERVVKSFAVQKSESSNVPNYAYLVNYDGSMAVLAINESEKVLAWGLWTTDAEVNYIYGYTSVCSAGGEVWVTCRRSGLGDSGYTIERLDRRMLFDNGDGAFASEGSPATITSDMTWLEPPSSFIGVEAYVDGVIDTQTTFSNGDPTEITFTEPAVEEWQAGLPFPVVDDDEAQVWLQTMPVEQLEVGMAMEYRSIGEVMLNLYQTRHLRVDGKRVAFRLHGSGVLDRGVPSFTGIKSFFGVRGWSRNKQLNLTQNQSLPMTLVGMALKVYTA